ncbi:hypothetical protein [Streptomyces sp. NPDC058157]|uniref:hypothetical protein n=1 Tax=Streptomyces sp. NPDC058157 TaxID=3346360 RepID=UPI0036E61A79
MLAGATSLLVHNCDISDGYLYRGLAEGHNRYDAAAEGRSVPVGGNKTIEQHSGGNLTDSIFTSWTDDPETAAESAQTLGEKWVGRGVMLRIKVAGIDPAIGPSRNIQIHDTPYENWGEDEHLIVGEILADEISFDLGKTWSTVRR